MTVYFMIMAILHRTLPSSLKVLFGFLLFLTFYGIFELIGNRNYVFLQALLGSIGPIYVFYEFSCRGLVKVKLLKTWFWIFLLFAVWTYYNNQLYVLENTIKNIDANEVVNNMSYILIGLFPFVFLFKNKYLQLSIILFISFFTLIGLKRGAILLLVLLILWYVQSSIFLSTKSRIKNLFIIGALVAAVYYFALEQFATNDALVHRWEMTLEGNSSGRDDIYAKYWDYYFMRASTLEQIFGGGAWYTEHIGHVKAHNDWLEILIDFGIVGCVFYMIFWIIFWRDIRRMNRKTEYYSIGIACFILTFCRTPFSMLFYVIHIYISIMIAYSLSVYSISSTHNTKSL